MVAGHLQEKGGQLYAVLSYKDRNGKRCTKWITTGLPVKGNKKKAEAILMDLRKKFVPPEVGVWPISRQQIIRMHGAAAVPLGRSRAAFQQ